MDSAAQSLANKEEEKVRVPCSTHLSCKTAFSLHSVAGFLTTRLIKSLTCQRYFSKKTGTRNESFLRRAAITGIPCVANKNDSRNSVDFIDKYSFCEGILNSLSSYSKADAITCRSSFGSLSADRFSCESVEDPQVKMDTVSSEDRSARHSVDGGSSTVSVDVIGDGTTSETLSFHADDNPVSSAGSSPLRWPTRKQEHGNSQDAAFTGDHESTAWEGKKKTQAELSWEDHKKNGSNGQKQTFEIPEFEMMKERFAKLLLGEDMSGGGKGVCTALAISNAITNLSATVFGELWRLEPLASERKAMWKREMGWLLSVSDYIVELIPAFQSFPDGTTLEIMVTRPRSDLHINLPALRKLDAMLLDLLEGFKHTEFYYVDQGVFLTDADGCGSVKRPPQRQEEKWWLPIPRVPPCGLSDSARKTLQHQRECTNQILKAAISINNNVLSEMEIPDAYLEALPKNGRASLGDIIYRYITAEQFSPDCLLDCLDLSSEHHTLEIANRIEAAIYVWRRRLIGKQCNGKENRPNIKSSWGLVKDLMGDTEKRELLADRAESLLLSLKQRFPGLSQTALDMNKIQYNRDVGLSILESYSRVLESLAFNIIARIDDLLYVDDFTRHSEPHQYSPIPPSVSNRGSSAKKGGSTSFSVSASASTPYSTAYTTPKFSTPSIVSPSKTARTSFVNSKSTSHQVAPVKALSDYIGGESMLADANSKEFNVVNGSISRDNSKYWSYPENLGSRKDLI